MRESYAETADIETETLLFPEVSDRPSDPILAEKHHLLKFFFKMSSQVNSILFFCSFRRIRATNYVHPKKFCTKAPLKLWILKKILKPVWKFWNRFEISSNRYEKLKPIWKSKPIQWGPTYMAFLCSGIWRFPPYTRTEKGIVVESRRGAAETRATILAKKNFEWPFSGPKGPKINLVPS